MARYDVRTAALALDIPYPTLDVLLARHDVCGVTRSAQGIRRTVDDAALVTLRIAIDLRDGLGVSFERGLEIARGLQRSGEARQGAVTISVNLEAVRLDLAARLSDAIERAVPIRRGRPPRGSGGLA